MLPERGPGNPRRASRRGDTATPNRFGSRRFSASRHSPSTSRRDRTLPTAILVMAAIGAMGIPKAGAQGTRQFFTDRADVHLVELNVVVTDRKGRFERGLDGEDLELYVDGQPVDILQLRENWLGTAEAGTRSASIADPSAIRTQAGASRARATVVLYLDETNLRPSHRSRSLNRLKAALQPWEDTGVAFLLVSSAGSRPEVHGSIPQSLEGLLEAAERISRGTAHALWLGNSRRRVIHELAAGQGTGGPFARVGPTATCKDAWHRKMAIARDFAAGEENRYAAAIDTLGELVALLAGLDGPKILVHLTSSCARRSKEAQASLPPHLHRQIDRRVPWPATSLNRVPWP